MRKLFLKLSMLLFVLGMSMNAAWADMQKIYVASLKAQTSSESTGSGDVKLTWLDIKGEEMDVDLARGLNNAAFGNPSHISEGETAQLIGGTLFAMDGVETPMGSNHIYMTSFLYFLAEGEPANGSYFSHWTFTDPAISRIDTAMGNGGAISLKSPCYKVLPDTTNNGKIDASTGSGDTKFSQSVVNVVTNPNNLYAVFKKYLLSNPVVTNQGTLTATEGDYTTINVSVDVEGDITQFKENYADFVFPSYPTPATPFDFDDEGQWTWAMDDPVTEVISPTKMRAHVVVTYTAKSAITVGRHNTTLTIKMEGGEGASELNIPLSVEVRPASNNEASVKIGNAEPTEHKTLADAVTAANEASGDVTLTLLKDVSSSITLTNTMTLDLNSYTLRGALIVNASGEAVTLAFNKQGGEITSPVTVAAGTLELNGGKIAVEGENNVVAVAVAAGATLIQNGATITAEASQKGAVGIYNSGTVTINEGSIYAESGYNTAVAVNAENGSTTYINGGSLSALAKEEEGTEDMEMGMTPEAISTWTNAYAVNVADGSTVEVNGGDLYAEATNAERAYGVSTLAGFGGTLTVNKKAVIRAKSPNTWYSFPVAVMAGEVTLNGGKYDGHYVSQHTGDTINPAVFGIDYSNVTFKAGMCKTDVFFIENPNEPFATSLLHPEVTMFKVVKGGKDYNDGYRYIAVADPATQSDLIAAGVPAARIGTTGYTKLEDAIAYANNNPSEELVIFMQNNYTLPAGYYTLPAKATLVIPMSDEQAKEINAFPPRMSFNDMDRTHPYLEPTEFRRLTIARGVNMNVYGKIEMTCTQFASNEAYTGQPYGPYGRIVMEEGSHLTLMSGSEVRAWGFMTGKGEIDVRRDAIVREMFQLGDWKGAMTSVKITGMMPENSPIHVGDDSDKKIFPVSQYFIQNIESPVKYHPGAVLSTSAMVSEGLNNFLAVSMTASDIKIVGVNGRDSAIFVMDNGADAENTWVRKWYDVENDIQVYEVNNSAHIGQMVLDMGELDASFIIPGFSVPVRLNSGKFDLPITCNFKIHLLSGAMDFLQNTSLLPGAEVEVDKEATVSVYMDEVEKNTYDAWVKGGKQGETPISYTGALYVYDAANWGEYAYGNAYDQESGSNEKYTAYTKVVRYSPSWEGRPTKRNEQSKPASAAINVHGTFQTATGFVYTSANGANIFSTNEDAGTFIFNDSAVYAGERKVWNVEGESSYRDQTFYSAKLKNGNGEHINTSEAEAGDAYCYINDEWTTMYPDENNPCFMVKHNTNGEIFYAKPQEYVAVVAHKELNLGADLEDDSDDYYEILGNADHTYSDAAGAGRLFILMENCQWWEVENVDNLYHCLHPNNDTYYYWVEDSIDKIVPEDKDTWVTYPAHWEEKRFTITWKNWDGTPLKTIGPGQTPVTEYSVTYGTMAEFLGNNPTRKANVDSTYNFTGWKPALGPVTQDVTYTATYESQPRMYTIIFQNEGGSEIERQFLEHNAVPVCENTPTKVGHTLVWSPAISPVIGDQIYTATWLENPPTEWDVTFVNNAGDELQATSAVAVNEHPVYSGSTPAKENADHTAYSSNEYTYTFWGWNAVIDGVAQQFAAGAELPCPTAPTTYTAVYTEAQKTYTVIFQDENGTEIERHDYAYGETPVCSATPTKANTAQYTYSFAWTPQIQTVQGAATYQAVFTPTTNKYTVTLQCNLPGKCTFTGAGTYDYGTSVSIVATPADGYSFVKWQETGSTNPALGAQTIIGDVTLTAVVKETAKDDPVDMTVGINSTRDVASAADVMNLIITSNGIDASSQLTGADNITLYGNADFVLSKDLAKRKWYCVAVPWRVEANGGIFIGNSSTPAVLGTDLDICYYDGAVRATQGKVSGCWVYMKNLSTKKILEPGRAYMIALLQNPASSITFRKKVQEPILTTGTSVQEYPSATATDAGWNAIANPSLFHAFVNAGSTDDKAQRYNSADDSYEWFDLDEHKLVVGEPIYVQAPAAKSIVVANGASYAPARRANAQAVPTKYEVSVTAAGSTKYADHLSITLNEDKEDDQYIIGQDLVKFGVSGKVAQMWIDRYDAKLCVNAVALESDATEFPLSISAPKAGNYTIAIEREVAAEDYNLYLTYNGEAIWNLSDGAYVANLNKGTDANYGLRISVRKTPEIVTGIDEAVVDAKGDIRKVLINDKVFIIRGEKVYSIDGQLVK